jgi:hypothetical protein
MKRLIGLILLASVGLGGCVYDPAYYHRSGVAYDDGTAYSGSYYDSGYYAPAYYGYGPGYYYDPWYAWGWPVGFSFYGSYYGGGHHHHYSHSGTRYVPHHH